MRHGIALMVMMTLIIATDAFAQEKTKMDLQLRAFLSKPHFSDEQVDLYVHGDVEAIASVVKALNGTVKMYRPSLVAVRLPITNIAHLAEHSAVKNFEFSADQGYALNDSMRVKNFINPVQQGLAPLPQGYDGTDVIIGVIDAGMDVHHPDLQFANGDTRVLKYWDQTLPNSSTTPAEFGYGQVWDSTAINAGQITSIDLSNGHGTTVTGTAAGNGLANGKNKGVASNSDILFVSVAFSGNFKAHVADAVKYIFDQAAALGKPVSVNASVGSYLGSHDGLDASALFIDDLLNEQGGRAMVCAAGNSGAIAAYHMQHTVTADTSFTWFKYNASSGLGYPAVYFELWADAVDMANIQYAVGADMTTPSFGFRGSTPFHNVAQNIGTVLVDTLWSTSGNQLGIVDYYLNQRGDQYQLQVQMQTPDSNALNFRFMTTGSGKFDVWSGAQWGSSNMVTVIPTVAQFPDIVNYVMPDNNKHMVDSWACSDHVLTVANYSNEVNYIDYNGNPATVPGVEGAISVNSSKGPTRDERIKPDLGATGDITMSAGPLTTLASLIANEPFKVAPGGMHMRNGGTSMASPVVAGAAALYLQRCPNAPHQEVVAAIRNTAYSDTFTGTTPNNQWGFGKLNAFDAVVGAAPALVELIAPATICQGSTVDVVVPGEYAFYEWSNGGAINPLPYAEEGPLSVQLVSMSGCSIPSDTVTFTIVSSPDQPTISQVGSTLTSSIGMNYQWYLNGVLLVGETGQSIQVGLNGSYTVAVGDGGECTTTSEPVFMDVTSVQEHAVAEFRLWPSPALDVLSVQLPAGSTFPVVLQIFDARGRSVKSSRVPSGSVMSISLDGLSAGTYLLQATRDGRSWEQRFVKLP